MTSWLNDIASQIQKELEDVVPTSEEVNDLIGKLTLTSPELAEEQGRITAEESRKESVKDALASILPWDTRNEEHEILVAECKEEILSLSLDESTFSGPYGNGDKNSEDEAKKVLEDYPTMLQEFDLDAHVGLVQRLFSEDLNLVEIHSQFSGAGDKEYFFWKNYFYHCAVIRSKVGLSNSEIWDVPTVSSKVQIETNLMSSLPFLSSTPISILKMSTANASVDDDGEDVSITFDSNSHDSSSALSVKSATIPSLDSTPDSQPNQSESPASSENDYDIISPTDEQVAIAVSAGSTEGDDELDDLAAEIARELES